MFRCEPLIDCNRAAEIMGLHPKTVKLLAQAGKIPGLKVGSVWRFRESALDEWISLHLKSSMPLAAAGKEEANGS